MTETTVSNVTVPEEDPPLTDTDAIKVRWTNRRRIAYISLISVIVLIQEMIVLAFFLKDTNLEAVSAIITTGIFVLGTLVATYMGAATLSEAGFWQGKKK